MKDGLVELLRDEGTGRLDVNSWPREFAEGTVRSYGESWNDPKEKSRRIRLLIYTAAAYLALC
ncbi:MAG: hypothetical protein ABIH92_05080 [Nanoarchaeota archaeon]